jgi:hypothetical protein
LENAIQDIEVRSALILADANEKPFEVNGVLVEMRSAAEWLLKD